MKKGGEKKMGRSRGGRIQMFNYFSRPLSEFRLGMSRLQKTLGYSPPKVFQGWAQITTDLSNNPSSLDQACQLSATRDGNSKWR